MSRLLLRPIGQGFEVVAATGFAATRRPVGMSHFQSRLGLLMRCYALRMMRAERAFIRFENTGGIEHERSFAEYVRQANKAARLATRHGALVRRVLGGGR